MTRTTLACAALAVALHALLLFAVDWEEPAAPLPPAPPSLRVSLLASGPAAAPAAASDPAPPVPAAAPAPPRPPKPAPKPRPREAAKPPPRASASRTASQAAPAPEVPAAATPEGGATGGGGARGERHDDASQGAAGGEGTRTAPRYRSTPDPEYPAAARRARQEGVVVLRVEVAANGRPSAVEVARSSGHAALDRAAVAGVRRWRFEPARRAGLPVAAQVEVPVRFRLDD